MKRTRADLRDLQLFNQENARKIKNNNYWVNAARVLLFDDEISADVGLVVD
jgi:hypothetical protein